MDRSVKLTYFGVRGKGEIIRLLLHVGKVDFVDERITKEDWPELKPSMLFGQVPRLIWDGQELYQSNSIVRFVAQKVWLVGKTEDDFTKADMLLEHSADFFKELRGLRFAEADSKQTLVDQFLQKFLPGWLEGAEKALKLGGGEFYVGNQLTFADIAVYTMLSFLMWEEEKGFQNVNAEDRFLIMDKYPMVKRNYLAVQSIPEVKKYEESRPDSFMPGM
ncbi:probable glutathione S-transferase 9 [Eurytemora carolleeae]|uniref:probable glutathione S-transferase 9 n=1 Tax=Eurytemora carolleeae TaxID=1294199 RepID=UPI000C75A642|nr:probable glutathione S-transferase 9 [Eurytemora carolleeae]|eukprot:XP_023329805.1 probable glutathione S-transferase 9 [Eurytemora affinis]